MSKSIEVVSSSFFIIGWFIFDRKSIGMSALIRKNGKRIIFYCPYWKLLAQIHGNEYLKTTFTYIYAKENRAQN